MVSIESMNRIWLSAKRVPRYFDLPVRSGASAA
jgi:hypothetical protein